MSPSTLCNQCKQSAGIKCLHCSQDFCRLHFREHEDKITHDIHPLLDRLNCLTEQNSQIDEHTKSLINQLHEWQENSHQIIDSYCQNKRKEIEEKLKEYQNGLHVKIQEVKDQIKPYLSNEFNIITNEQINIFEYQLNRLDKTMKETKPSLQLNMLRVDPKSVVFISETSVSALLNLKMPKRTSELKFDASPMATDGKLLLLQNTTYSLGLYEYDTLSLYRQIPCLSSALSNLVDLQWSSRLEQFLILTRDHLYTLDKDFILCDTFTNTKNDFRTITTNDDCNELFIATCTSIEQYSLLTFNFSKRYNLNDYHIYSLRYNLNINQFGLTIRTCREHKWYFEVRDRSLLRLWCILTPIESGSCLVSILFNCNEWIVVNSRDDILFQITTDGQMKAEVIYPGRHLLNAIENQNLLVVRTYGYLEQYNV